MAKKTKKQGVSTKKSSKTPAKKPVKKAAAKKAKPVAKKAKPAAKKPAAKKSAAKKPAAKKPAPVEATGKTTFPPPEQLSFADADAKLENALSVFQGNYDTVAYFKGDVVVGGDFLKTMAKPIGNADIVVIDGNLTVHGDFAIWDNTPGLLVTGKTVADTLQGGDAEIYIGEGTFKYCVYGYYNHGILETGTVQTPWVINSDHDLRVSAPSAKLVDNYGDSDDADFTRQNIADAFVKEIVDPEYNSIIIEKFIERLRKGQPVLKSGAKTAVEAALGEVAQAKEAGEVELDLTKKKLKKFPAHVLAMPWLKKLVLDDNEIGEVPDEIGELTELEYLSLADCNLRSLPDSIGNLKKLRVLRVPSNVVGDEDDGSQNGIVLPDTIGDLESLEELDVSACSVRPPYDSPEFLPELSPYELPAGVGRLKNLKKIVARNMNVVFPASMRGMESVRELKLDGGSWAYARRMPDGVESFPNLVKLDISSNFYTEIPQSILQLQKLEELDLGNALGLVKAPLPDFGKLPALRVLNVSGNTDHTGVPVPKHTVLRQVLDMNMPALEDLRVDRWGPQDKGQRDKPTPETFTGLGKYKRLKRIELCFNDLTALPDDFYTLAELEWIDVHYNKLPKEERQRLIQTFPHTKIDLRNQDVPKEQDSEDTKRARALIVEGKNLRSQNKWNAALERYDQALKLFDDGSANSAYNQLYALYSKMWVHGTAGYGKDGAEATRAKHRKDGVEIARQCLQLVPPVWAIWHFTDEGEFHREVVRYATNFLAWEAMKSSPTPEDLSGALELIERGVACADRQHLYVRDTHARVLYALGRQDEAWKVVHQIQSMDPSFKDIKDLAKNKGYKVWLSAQS